MTTQHNTTLKVIMLCVICTTTMMSGCVDDVPDNQTPYTIGETVNFTRGIHVYCERYEVEGQIEYLGDDRYHIRSGGYNDDGDKYLMICGETDIWLFL